MPKSCWYKRLGSVATNQIISEVCVFARNIIIARLIGAEALGEFVFLVLAIRLFAMSTDLAMERYILQAPKHATAGALAATHGIVRVRCAALGLCLIVMGYAAVQGISFTCYALLAASAVVRGFTHYGYRLEQRSLNFRPAMIVESSTIIIATLVMLTVAFLIPTLEAMCAVMVAHSCMQTALSHYVSRSHGHRYFAPTPKSEIIKIARYGWPLMLGGLAMFWSMQGERVILSTIMTAEQFAHFSMMFQLALVPVLVMGRVALTAGLPAMANVAGNQMAFANRLKSFQLYTYLSAVFFALGFILLANPVLSILFGPSFQTNPAILLFVGLMQALRLCRTPHSITAQALGHTDIPFKANLVRVSVVGISVIAALNGGTLVSLLIIACIGEIAAWSTQHLLFKARVQSTKTNSSSHGFSKSQTA